MVAIVASPIGAQTTQSTSQCHYVGTVLHCDTASRSTSSPYDAFNQEMSRQREEQERQRIREEAARPAQESQWRRQRAGKMIAKGDCAGAKAFALKSGDFDLVKQVQSLCLPSAP